MTTSARLDLVLSLKRRGIGAAVLRAMEAIPREMFVEPAFVPRAYADMALPIGCGQTIAQPYVVALMADALSLTPTARVLEIGTGSGYQAAVLSRLARTVYSIERHAVLAKLAQQRFRRLRLGNITTHIGDGCAGWPGHFIFDRILITAAAAELPPALVAQLAPGGVIVAPVDGPAGQTLMRYTYASGGLVAETIMRVRFVPLVAG